jgi:tetratricopeptide (TPR) repeat protein
MNRIITQLTLFFICTIYASAQVNEAEQLVAQGIKLSNEGSYSIAISRFEDALQLDEKLIQAKYELAYIFLKTGNSEKAAKYSKEVMKADDSLKLEATLILGAAYDQQHESKKSLKVYKKAVKEFPENNLAQFNLGLSYYNSHDWDEAESCLIKATSLDNSFPGSHFLLAHIMLNKGETVKSMLSLYYFLLLEQDTERTEDAYEILEELWKSNVTNLEGQKVISINNGNNDFYKMVDLAIKMKAATYTGNFEPSDRLRVFSENTVLLFDVISQNYDGKLGFWELTYLDFFKELHEKGYTESFAYYISNSSYRPQVLVWLSDHYSEFNSFINWMDLHQ